MIDPLPLKDLVWLWERTNGPCLSIYVPMETHGAETRKNPIRFKNALAKAEEQLGAQDIRQRDRDALLGPMRDLLHDRPFWEHQSLGLAAFRTLDTTQTYRKNLTFPELTVVSDRFHLKPLLDLFSADVRFYVLTLSLHEVALYEGTRGDLHEIDLADTPKTIEDALRYDVPEKSLQYHSKTPPTERQPQPTGQRPAIFHGHGGGADDAEHKKHILRFFREVDRGVAAAIDDQEAPLILAGVHHELAIYREANTYPHLLSETVAGDVTNLDSVELHERAWRHLQPIFDRERRERIERLRTLSKTERVSEETRTIVPAARDGRVDTLFVPVGIQRWGRFDPDRREVREHALWQPGDVDLLDAAAVWTLRNGGKVYVERPAETDLETLPAAIFRY